MHASHKADNRALKRVRRSACLVFFFEKGDLRCTNYLTGITVASTPKAVLVLRYLDVWRNYEEIERLFSGYSATSLRSILRQLLERYADLGRASGDLNALVQAFAGTSRGEGTPPDADPPSLEAVQQTLSVLVDRAAAVGQAAEQEDFEDIARQADSLRQQLLSARNKLNLLAARHARSPAVH